MKENFFGYTVILVCVWIISIQIDMQTSLTNYHTKVWKERPFKNKNDIPVICQDYHHHSQGREMQKPHHIEKWNDVFVSGTMLVVQCGGVSQARNATHRASTCMYDSRLSRNLYTRVGVLGLSPFQSVLTCDDNMMSALRTCPSFCLLLLFQACGCCVFFVAAHVGCLCVELWVVLLFLFESCRWQWLVLLFDVNTPNGLNFLFRWLGRQADV